jgi:hypothetical protein
MGNAISHDSSNIFVDDTAEIYAAPARRAVNRITGFEIQGPFNFGPNRDNRGGGNAHRSGAAIASGAAGLYGHRGRGLFSGGAANEQQNDESGASQSARQQQRVTRSAAVQHQTE